MQQRDRLGRYKTKRMTTRWEYIVCLSILGGIFTGIWMDKHDLNPWNGPVVYVKVAEAATTTPPVVLIELDYSSKESIEKLIRATFPEEPNTAVAVAKAESGGILQKELQSYIIKDGVREPSYCTMQIHAPSWMIKARKLGYGDYKTNVESCIKMARVIYNDKKAATGNGFQAWSAYNNGSYKKYL